MNSGFWQSDLFFILFEVYIMAAIVTCFHVVLVTSAAHSVLCLVFLFILISFIFIMIGAEYVGLVYILVYVGAIAILFLFVVMLLDLRSLTVYEFNKREIFWFTWSIMAASDITCYVLGYARMDFFALPLIPVSSLIDITGAGRSIVDNLAIISPALYNLFWVYVIGSGFLLVFVMVGIVLMLSEKLTVANHQMQWRNKITVRANRLVYLTRNRHGV